MYKFHFMNNKTFLGTLEPPFFKTIQLCSQPRYFCTFSRLLKDFFFSFLILPEILLRNVSKNATQKKHEKALFWSQGQNKLRPKAKALRRS